MQCTGSIGNPKQAATTRAAQPDRRLAEVQRPETMAGEERHPPHLLVALDLLPQAWVTCTAAVRLVGT
jgi:hypothetical protein